MGQKWSKSDKRNMVLALVGFILVMGILILGGLLGANANDDMDMSGGGSTEAPTTTETPFPPKRSPYRLPTSLIPKHYTIRLQPHLQDDFMINGYVEVGFYVEENTSNITIHMVDIDVDENSVEIHTEISTLHATNMTYDQEKQWMVIEMDNEVVTGEGVVLSMNFTGLLNDQLRGFYRSSYINEMGDEEMLAASFFAPTEARRAFPCLDEPEMKAIFIISLAREEQNTAQSNMPLKSTEPMPTEEGWVWDHFEVSPKMSTYLVAFVISDFEVTTEISKNVTYSVWARRSMKNQTELGLQTAWRATQFYEDYLNISYPLPKQDLVALPELAPGAMENWGLITFRESRLLYEEGVTSARNKQAVMETICHELAHQWFGNLVTPQWWNDIWLNEGFASYMSYVAMNSLKPSWEEESQMLVNVINPVMTLDSLTTSHPVSNEVNNPDEINQIYDSIVYDKGASIIRMMRYFLTEATFIKALTNYLNTFKYSVATQDDLWHHLTEAGHEDGTLPLDLTIKEIMDTWTLQKNYPVITITRGHDNTAVVMQERFLLKEPENSTWEEQDYKWWIPLTITDATNPNFTNTTPTWIPNYRKSISLNSIPDYDKWIMANLQQSGFYRVNYDEHNWNLIIEQLKDDCGVIHVNSRVQVIDDALNLARAGWLNYDTALGINSYLSFEEEYAPWRAALSGLSYLEMMMTRTPGYGPLKHYLLEILTPLYDSVEYEDDLDDEHLVQLKRAMAVEWTCHLGHDDCLQEATEDFNGWLNETSSISPNVKGSVLCTGVAEGGVTEWDGVWDMYLDSDSSSETRSLLQALGCSKEIWLLSRTLELAFTEDSGISKMDSTYVFNAVASNDYGRTLAWNFLRNNWDGIVAYYNTFDSLGSLIKSATREFNTQLELSELEQFYLDEQESLEMVSSTISEAVANTKSNIEWIDNNYDIIVDWLHKNGYASS